MHKITNSYIAFLDAHKNKLLLLHVILLIGFVVFFLQLKVDLSTEAFLFEDDLRLIRYSQFQEYFGNDEILVFAVSGNVFTNEYLSRLYDLQQNIIENLPYVKNTTSLLNIDQFYAEPDTDGLATTLKVQKLIPDVPERTLAPSELLRLKEEVLNDPIYPNQIISESGNMSAIIVELYTRKEIEQFLQDETTEEVFDNDTTDFEQLDNLFDEYTTQEGAEDSAVSEGAESTTEPYSKTYLDNEQSGKINTIARDIISKHTDKDFHVELAGYVLLVPTMILSLVRDAFVFFPLLLGLIMLFIILMFKRMSAVVYSMFVALFTLIGIFGIMGVSNTAFTLVSNIFPPVIVSIGIGSMVHLLTLLYKKYDSGCSKVEALTYTFNHSGWPIILTNLTSAAGIFSFFYSTVKPIQDFGLFGALGLLLALFLIMMLIPLIILRFPMKRRPIQQHKISHVMDTMLSSHAGVVYKFRVFIVLFTLVVLAISVWGIQYVYFSYRPLEWLPSDNTLRTDTENIDKVMKGSNFLEIFIDTKEQGGIYSPEFLRKTDQIENYLYQYKDHQIRVGKVFSINDIIKKTHQVLNNNDEQYYTIPSTREAVAQELLLVENGGGDVLDNFTDINYSVYRITLTLPGLNAVYFSRFLQDIEQELDRHFSHTDYTYYTTGGVAILARIIDETILNARTSYIIAFIVITILMILLTRNIVVGLVSMIPNLSPIFILLAIIGFTPIELDIFVLLTGCVLLGIAVDNTIHYIHVYKNYLAQGNSIEKSMRLTFLSTGKAMIISSIILLAGFSVLIFANMRNFYYFGLMSLIGICAALFFDFFLTPVLMIYLTKKKFLLPKPNKTKEHRTKVE